MRFDPARLIIAVTLAIFSLTATTDAQSPEAANPKHIDPYDPFAQLDPWWPTPTDTRIASGAPGPAYWQQRADYEIDVTIDDENQRIIGKEKVHYHNKSPHTLSYIWVQLDQNRFRQGSDALTTATAPSLSPRISFQAMKTIMASQIFDGGYKIAAVTDESGKELSYRDVGTMMRIDLPEPLKPGKSTTFGIEYSYNIVDAKTIRSRGGKEYFEDDDNYIYEIAQWFPRVASYTDFGAWQHKAFLGRGEFTLELGDYIVRITVPEEMVVASTGVLINGDDVLKPEWSERLETAKEATRPMFIVTPEEAKENESVRSKKTKTWEFKADNVRDFAFAASRKFIWDAMGVEVGSQTVMSMSYYPNEAEPLWSQYSTESVAHTLEVYGRYSFEYPYPVAISVNGPVYGMEYPMICFNGPRPEEDGTYSKATKYGLISVVIHEVGHNFFPMIVNSDERQWTWMDEGLNTFLQYLTEQEWEENYPSRRGEPANIVGYMRGGNQRPIMTGSEEILQFGDNAYGKPATALNILRETILGRELFDHAFREYARRWKFKRPTPSDFFRTMEDASGTDLDWFWRGWFYSTKHVDLGITNVQLYQIDAGDPDEAAERKRQEKDKEEPSISELRNKDLPRRIEWQPGLKDFYNNPDYDEDKVEEDDRKSFQKFLDGLDSDERAMLRRTTNFYVVEFENHGGLVMPIILRVYYGDSTTETMTMPAQIWRQNSKRVKKLITSDKEIVRMELDPHQQTADVNMGNNHWPEKLVPSRFKLFKSSGKSKNPMQRENDRKGDQDKKESESDDKKADEKKDESKDAAKPEAEKKPEEKKADPKAEASEEKEDKADEEKKPEKSEDSE
ncbi:M1 family metallopeptidase [Stieleria sp. JC731]|uniref:M1 family metallopeptidase n=1 Tax=Pirellulaceae TaxID=2691357 RepID=UPI001E49DCDF|nr:M1 family metallopeptidase [Stieleria sp. JC731]MCC9599417.1 M1 family metallopeptidase [Stieleria sp. JC731]